MKLCKSEKINPNEVIHVSLTPINGEPHIFVVTNKESITQPLTNGWELFKCNEFLKSLNVCPDEYVHFENYVNYSDTVDFINRLIEYKHIMEELTQTRYADIDILAYQVYSVVLNRLLAKHHMAKMGYFTAIVKRPLEKWIAEAMTYFK